MKICRNFTEILRKWQAVSIFWEEVPETLFWFNFDFHFELLFKIFFFFLFPKVVFLGENSCPVPIILPSSVLGWWVIILIFITAGFDRKWVKRLFTFLYLLAGGPPTVILLLLPPLDPRSTLRVQLLKDLASGVITRKMEKRWLKARLFRHHY